jgi:hypothetical protein
VLVVFGDFDWRDIDGIGYMKDGRRLRDGREKPLLFRDRDSAVGHAKSILGRLANMNAPGDVTVTVLQGDKIEVSYSVASWRTTVRFIGEKAYP